MSRLALIPDAAIATYPDSDRYKCRFDIRSESSGRIYRVSFDAAIGAWVCSCPGNIRHGSCKHLESMGLQGRKFGKDLTTLRNLGLPMVKAAKRFPRG